MNTSKTIYKGSLRTETIHLKSSDTIITDAPTDNQGKGEAFSPTDLVATALVSCMLTIMGIKARDNGLNIEGTTGEVLKTMASNPRRISQLDVVIHDLPSSFSDKEKKILERAALTCPVFQSIHPDIKVNTTFEW